MYKRNSFGRKYIYIITQKPMVFIGFVLLGIVMFLYLTTSLKLNIYSIHEIQYEYYDDGTVVSLKNNDIISDSAYFYTDKHDAVIPVSIEVIASGQRRTYIRIIPKTGEDVISEIWQQACLEMPVNKESLFSRIIRKGGKNRE